MAGQCADGRPTLMAAWQRKGPVGGSVSWPGVAMSRFSMSVPLGARSRSLLALGSPMPPSSPAPANRHPTNNTAELVVAISAVQ
eukprot:1553086-Lingulodinium_polyedra.AAC.1